MRYLDEGREGLEHKQAWGAAAVRHSVGILWVGDKAFPARHVGGDLSGNRLRRAPLRDDAHREETITLLRRVEHDADLPIPTLRDLRRQFRRGGQQKVDFDVAFEFLQSHLFEARGLEVKQSAVFGGDCEHRESPFLICGNEELTGNNAIWTCPASRSFRAAGDPR